MATQLLRVGKIIPWKVGIGVALLILSGCPVSELPADDLPANTPAVPLPTYPGESLPATSEILVYMEADIGDFEPQLDNVPPSVIAAYPGAVWVYHDPHPQQRLMVDDGAIVDPVLLRIKVEYSSGTFGPLDRNGPALAECPKVRWVRYWKRLVSVVIPHPTNYQQSHTYTEGTSETTGESFAISLGLSASGWGVGLSAQLTYTFNREVTISSETSVTKTFTCESEPGKVLQFTVWQLIDEYQICDSDGDLFTDPEYDVSSSLAVASETDQLYMSVVKFSQ